VEGYEWKRLFPKPCERPLSMATERITAIDTLLGFVLLGILLMNVVGFGMYSTFYDNPDWRTRANLPVRAVMHALAESKMRCLFSMVFGAGVTYDVGRFLPCTGDCIAISSTRGRSHLGFAAHHQSDLAAPFCFDPFEWEWRSLT
jgi:uncharacterized membrane protein YeiB